MNGTAPTIFSCVGFLIALRIGSQNGSLLGWVPVKCLNQSGTFDSDVGNPVAESALPAYSLALSNSPGLASSTGIHAELGSTTGVQPPIYSAFQPVGSAVPAGASCNLPCGSRARILPAAAAPLAARF